MMQRIIVCLAAIMAAFASAGASEPNIETGSSRSIVHEVRWGDTLARLAREYYGDGKKFGIIASANGIADPDRIICGTRIVIPIENEGEGITAALPPSVAVDTATEVSAPLSSTAAPSALPVPEPACEDALAEVPVSTASSETAGLPFEWRKQACTAFGEREKLTFTVKWQFIKVGSATMEIKGFDEIDGRRAYHIFSEAKSAPFFDAFYRVRDTNESWIDAESLCSLKFASKISEGNAKRTETIVFHHEKKQFMIEENKKSGTIPQWVQDVLSALYYVRNQDLVEGGELSVDAHSGDESWPLTVRVLRKEKIKVAAGKYKTIVIEPFIREGAGIFQAKGKLQIWVTDDDRKIPVLMRSKIAVGAIEAELVDLER